MIENQEDNYVAIITRIEEIGDYGEHLQLKIPNSGSDYRGIDVKTAVEWINEGKWTLQSKQQTDE